MWQKWNCSSSEISSFTTLFSKAVYHKRSKMHLQVLCLEKHLTKQLYLWKIRNICMKKRVIMGAGVIVLMSNFSFFQNVLEWCLLFTYLNKIHFKVIQKMKYVQMFVCLQGFVDNFIQSHSLWVGILDKTERRRQISSIITSGYVSG